jgi:hypothetical protein
MTLKHSRSSLTAADAKLSYTYMPIATSALLNVLLVLIFDLGILKNPTIP